MGTFHGDVSFKNHAGYENGIMKNTYALAESYFDGIHKPTINDRRKEYYARTLPNQTYASMMNPE
ncbi:hypothetical protein F3J28_03430 [Enterobacter sp. Ap-1006]|uniref:hypothetical protein n=1 Tax=Enterobacter sp. Ap-1006 TaxID=2608345 RepID=UPI00141EDED2|nr:hypothetical protein [Enterobacter sp. Ap-1006]NIF46820.1 hypothetical protein [Enterobacter sp. Ap-1006]